MEKMEIKRWWWLLLMVAVIWFGTLEYRKLIKPDEGRYAEIPREMVASGEFVIPCFYGMIFFYVMFVLICSVFVLV